MSDKYRIFFLVVIAAIVVGAIRVVIDDLRQPAAELSSETAVSSTAAKEIQRRQAQVMREQLPDFSSYKSVRKKKQAFFSYLLPLIRQENQRIREVRAQLQAWRAQVEQGEALSAEQRRSLQQKVRRYKIDLEQYAGVDLAQAQSSAEQRTQLTYLLDALLLRIDIVPASLVMAQAANESAWGTSRFATKANNLFGQWCFVPGCGLVPESRDDEQAHEVAFFASPKDSVVSYIRNLNSHSAYETLRMIRASLRAQKLIVSGELLAEGLHSYSSRGIDYVEEIRALIRINNLAKYDPPPSLAPQPQA